MNTIRGKHYPLQPICDCWHPSRCPRKGFYSLITAEGTYCPGGPVCRQHGKAIVTEYRQKIQQQWGLRHIQVHR